MEEATNGNGYRAFTLKEIVLEMRDDVKEIGHKLDRKVERDEFFTLQNRVSDLELHGSNQAIAALQDLREVEAELSSVRGELRDRPAEMREHNKMLEEVDSLKTWRNRLIGSTAAVSVAALVNTLRILFGV